MSGVEAVAWCALSESGRIAYFDGLPMIMPGSVGNVHHPVALYSQSTVDTLRAQLEAAEAEWREKFEARTIDWSEASNALYVWRHRAKDAEARAEAAEAECARLGEVLDRIAGYTMSQFHSALDMASQCRTDAAIARTKEQQA